MTVNGRGHAGPLIICKSKMKSIKGDKVHRIPFRTLRASASSPTAELWLSGKDCPKSTLSRLYYSTIMPAFVHKVRTELQTKPELFGWTEMDRAITDLKKGNNSDSISYSFPSYSSPIHLLPSSQHGDTSPLDSRFDTRIDLTKVDDDYDERPATPRDKGRQLQNRNYLLTDADINVSQQLLHRQFPKLINGREVFGFQDTLLFAFKNQHPYIWTIPENSVAFQVLHINSNHWVLLYIDGSSVYVLDSLRPAQDKVSAEVASKVNILFRRQAQRPRMQYLDVQRQTGATICGVFCIAFALEILLHGLKSVVGKPHLFQQSAMRKYLATSLDNHKFDNIGFPKQQQ